MVPRGVRVPMREIALVGRRAAPARVRHERPARIRPACRSARAARRVDPGARRRRATCRRRGSQAACVFRAPGRRGANPAALRPPGRDHARDGIHRPARRPRRRVRSQRSRARPRDHSRQHQSPRARADDHRPQLPREDQRQHRQLRGRIVDRRGSRQAALGDAVGRRHGDGSLDGEGHPRDARVDPAQLARADWDRADLPGAREGRRPAGGADLGDLPRHARSSRPSRASTTSPCTPACCSATSR